MSRLISKKIEKMIYIIRGEKVMLDSDLAELYGVATKVLNQAVKRNPKRFPTSFMFQLDKDEMEDLRSQFVTFRDSTKGRKYRPYVFTEHGVAMLSAVLKSKTAVEVSILIVKTFVKIREYLTTNIKLEEKIKNLEQDSNNLFKIVFERLDNLEVQTPALPRKRRKIGIKK
ncbi:MAG: ORF6N domain-containing protein [Epsilonproteobacteria bacterium]|nr:MAG: ORF6N domain-containing protein [Campylobacterota bacterium]RLA65815.1 MAG: ORF6N domain-containing protein [Campylobacterota bacterium]